MTRDAYILVANNNHGKSTIQRNLAGILCGRFYDRLPSDGWWDVNHPDAPRSMKDAFIVNRSYQERLEKYGDIKGFFTNCFKEASVAILSSHSWNGEAAILAMITELKRRFYNVTGVFLSNGAYEEVALISQNDAWDGRILLNNPVATGDQIELNLAGASEELARHIIRRFASK